MNKAPYRATSHAQWFAALQDEALKLLNGQANASWALLAETALSLTPIRGQIADAYDTLHALNAVNTAPCSKAAWFKLFSALIGLVPGGGEVVKRSLRAVHSYAMPCNWLLDPIRQHYRGDAETLVRSMLQLNKLQRLLEDLLNAPSIQQQIDDSTRQQFQAIEHGLAEHFDAFKHQVERWLNEGAALNAQADFGGGQWVHPYPSQPPQTTAATAAPTDNAAALASVGHLFMHLQMHPPIQALLAPQQPAPHPTLIQAMQAANTSAWT